MHTANLTIYKFEGESQQYDDTFRYIKCEEINHDNHTTTTYYSSDDYSTASLLVDDLCKKYSVLYLYIETVYI